MECGQQPTSDEQGSGALSFGRMSFFIMIVSNKHEKDSEGFIVTTDKTLAAVRAYKEEKHGSETWKNRAAFSTATTLFRFRKIPNLAVTTEMFLICDEERYNIISAEDVKGRGLYVELLAEKMLTSEG